MGRSAPHNKGAGLPSASRGKTADDIRFQLANNPQMQSIKLGDDEVEAVAAYSQSLAKQPN